jgi:hypothetical protein
MITPDRVAAAIAIVVVGVLCWVVAGKLAPRIRKRAVLRSFRRDLERLDDEGLAILDEREPS